jgi:hypothetical protein
MVIPFRDRVGYLKSLLHWAANGKTLVKRIVIFDMETSHPKALHYLAELMDRGHVGEDQVPVTVFSVPNGGARSLFFDPSAKTLMLRWLGPNERFVLTDPDVTPEIQTRKWLLIQALHKILDKYRTIDKVGCALRIDDLPDHFPQKEKVIGWERRFWQNRIEDHDAPYPYHMYHADVATTFCLVRRYDALNKAGNGRAMRFAGYAMARHLPWYENPYDLSDDVRHYYARAPMRKWGDVGPGVSWSPLEEPNR